MGKTIVAQSAVEAKIEASDPPLSQTFFQPVENCQKQAFWLN
jgi:hypothetical protein